MPIDYEKARELLESVFSQAEADLLQGSVPTINERVRAPCETLFQSRTQAYREVLLGCIMARIQDENINIRQPYTGQGPNAFGGRSLDERVNNPFLQDKQIPSSRGPYLSVFRRSVQFDASTRSGLRDQSGYDAFLNLITNLESISDDSELTMFLRFLLYKFAALRESAVVPLSRLQRISLEQYESLISGLLATPSGGRLPVILVVAAFTAIKSFFGLAWQITWQGINVADISAGAGGDVTVTSGGQVVLAAEVTERPVDRNRVAATFNTKIAPAGIEDYLFFVTSAEQAAEAKQQAQRYFSQGHEVNFVEVNNWILMSLATMGTRGRDIFNKALLDLLDASEVPQALKMSWNAQIARITG